MSAMRAGELADWQHELDHLDVLLRAAPSLPDDVAEAIAALAEIMQDCLRARIAAGRARPAAFGFPPRAA